MATTVTPGQNDMSLVNLRGIGQSTTPRTTISPSLQTTLQLMVGNLVDALRCVGAVIATLDAGSYLVLRAYSLNIPYEFIQEIVETKEDLSELTAHTLERFDPAFENNLGVRAVSADIEIPETFIISEQLTDLLTSILPEPLIHQIQQSVGIAQLIAIPIAVKDDILGCMVAASRSEFTLQDINFLTAFSHQAATAIQTERQLIEIQALERVILTLQASMIDETQVLQIIVDSMVETLDYAGAIVATLEPDGALPVRAYRIDLPAAMLSTLEAQAGISLLGPDAVVYLDDPAFKENLSVKAIKGEDGRPKKYRVSDRLYDLFRPLANQQVCDIAQQVMQIKQVIAVPFFLDNEVVGNIFVATRNPRFTASEKELLTRFGQQATVGIRNGRLYKQAEERRQIASMFANMAFAATANIHTLRNHIGAFQAYTKLVELTKTLSQEHRDEVLDSGPNIMSHLNRAADILDSLHEPWRQTPDQPTNVNNCITWAVRKVFSNQAIDMDENITQTEDGFTIDRELTHDLPYIQTSPDMLTEALRIIMKNGVEAIKEAGTTGMLCLQSRLCQDESIQIIITDNGTGMQPQVLNRIFEMGWSTKKGEGMGFGLFWAKDYIEGLDGTIQVESTWGEGTTFTLTLPTTQTES